MTKTFFFFLCLTGFINLLAAETILDCQMLLTDQQIEEEGIAHQRKLYPKASAQRISQKAAQEGFAAKDIKSAMNEFNKAWRFAPENPFSYWGAAIVRGREAQTLSDSNLCARCWDESVKLFEKSLPLLQKEHPQIRENFNLDYSLALIGYGSFLRVSNQSKSLEYFDKAEKILLLLAERNNDLSDRARAVYARACSTLAELYSAKQNSLKAKEYAEKAKTATTKPSKTP